MEFEAGIVRILFLGNGDIEGEIKTDEFRGAHLREERRIVPYAAANIDYPLGPFEISLLINAGADRVCVSVLPLIVVVAWIFAFLCLLLPVFLYLLSVKHVFSHMWLASR